MRRTSSPMPEPTTIAVAATALITFSVLLKKTSTLLNKVIHTSGTLPDLHDEVSRTQERIQNLDNLLHEWHYDGLPDPPSSLTRDLEHLCSTLAKIENFVLLDLTNPADIWKPKSNRLTAKLRSNKSASHPKADKSKFLRGQRELKEFKDAIHRDGMAVSQSLNCIRCK